MVALQRDPSPEHLLLAWEAFRGPCDGCRLPQVSGARMRHLPASSRLGVVVHLWPLPLPALCPLHSAPPSPFFVAFAQASVGKSGREPSLEPSGCCVLPRTDRVLLRSLVVSHPPQRVEDPLGEGLWVSPPPPWDQHHNNPCSVSGTALGTLPLKPASPESWVVLLPFRDADTGLTAQDPGAGT